MAKDNASSTSLLLSSPDEAPPSAFPGIASASQGSAALQFNTHPVHSLVVVGASAPMLATARRMMNSMKT